MAAKLILPGLGGQYTSESFAATATGADTLDMSHCAGFAVEGGTGNGAGSVQVQQSFDMVTFANLGTAITVTSNGPVTLFNQSAGPFGVIRLSVTVTAGTVKAMTITGLPLQNFI